MKAIPFSHRFVFLSVLAVGSSAHAQQPARLPVFDVHLHAGTTAANEAAMRAMQDSMNVVKAVMIGTPSDLTKQAGTSSRFLRGLFFPCEAGKLPNVGAPCFSDNTEFPDTAWLRQQVVAGEVQVFGEVGAQYMGVQPNDPRMLPYFALAEQLDIPVGIHLGIGPPGVAYSGGPRRTSPHYSGQAGDPRLLESVLVAHPKMRMYVMHAAWPYLEEMTYMLYMHPQLYVDISVLQYAIPRPAYLSYLRALVDAGFAERIMFGSDGGARFLKEGVNAIAGAEFLSEKQKRDILHDNAARFFRISPSATPPRETQREAQREATKPQSSSKHEISS